MGNTVTAGTTGWDTTCAATPTTPGTSAAVGSDTELAAEFDVAAVESTWVLAIGAVEEVTAVRAAACS